MAWLSWVVVALATLEGGWLTFDGVRAFVTGEYVTPASGPHAGQLGPWSKLVAAVGLEPRSTTMKGIHVATGLTLLAASGCFAAGFAWSWTAMVIAAALGLWYLPVGTVLSAAQIALLLFSRRNGG